MIIRARSAAPTSQQSDEAGAASHQSSGTQSLLSVDHIQLGYTVQGTYTLAVQDVSFDILPAETLMLLGPSGCGKSTLLKSIAGFLEPTRGTVSMAGNDSLVPGPDRAVVFQDFEQLFPWRTVLDNVAYPLRRTGHQKKAAHDTARRYLEMTGLSQALDRFPHQLSGGMKQRVAIARALALDPKMLLMDEPFGSLDSLTRTRLQRELSEIVDQTKVTILFVTHSIEEAIVLGDRVLVLSQPPSTVRELYTVPEEARHAESEPYFRARTHLRELLENDEEEAGE